MFLFIVLYNSLSLKQYFEKYFSSKKFGMEKFTKKKKEEY